MRLTNSRRPGTGTAFVDATHDEILLQFSTDTDGKILIGYHLYDEKGALVKESDGLQPVKKALTIRKRGETLLSIPSNPDKPIRYRLYNRSGLLLTVSDGARTRIYRSLRMETC